MPVVLVVDDESAIRELLMRWIGADGCEVREAASAEAALEDMQALPADVVLCDVQMTGQTGLWLTAKVREQFEETAVVLVTADRTVPARVSLQPGVVEYLVKPFTRAEVLHALHAALRWHRDAVAERGHKKVVRPLTKEWVGSSGD